jgi:hypothetical protein
MPNVWESAPELQKMREAAENSMPDKGQRLIKSVTIDEVGDDIEVWQAGDETICGVEFHEGRENRTDITFTVYEILVRIPYDFEIVEGDHFLITKYKDQVVSWEYELTTPIQFGLANKRFGARLVRN